MIKLWQKLFPKPTLAEKLASVIDEQAQVLINAELTNLYHAHKVRFEQAKLDYLSDCFKRLNEKVKV